MATLKEFPKIITDLNETQMFIIRTILSQKEAFTQADIFKTVSERCRYAETFKVTNMVLNTFEQLLDSGELCESAGTYWVVPKQWKLKMCVVAQ